MSRAMKDSGISWIGEIPKEWEVVPFRSYTIERAEKNKGEKTRELLALSFALGVTLYEDKVYNMDRVKDNYEDYQLVYKNDLVLSPNDIIKGSVYVSKYNGCISPMYCVFSARNTNTHNLLYLSYLLRTKEAGRRFFFIARGLIGGILDNGKYVTRRMTVSRQDLLSFKVLLPPFPEQRKIVDFLDKRCGEIDETIALQEEFIEELKAYKQSVITEAVTRGLNPNVKLKDSGIDWIGKIPQGWKVAQLKRYAKVNNGKEVPVELDADDERAKPVYGSGGVFKYTNDTMYSGEAVMFGRKGTLGKPLYVNGSFWVVDTMYYLTYSNGLIPKYSYYQLSAFDWNPYITQTAIPSIVASDIMGAYVCIPHIDEQQQIVDYLDNKCTEIDSLIAIKQQKIEGLKDYKKSVIYEYVTGKKEIQTIKQNRI